MTLNTDFEKMMQYPNVGHNGGDENSPLWFVGLENNAGNAENCIQHNQDLLAHPDDKNNRLDLDKQDFESVFNQQLRAILGSDTKKVAKLYEQNNFFCANLYPFAFTGADDDNKIRDLTGGLTKAQYYDYCDLHRHTSKAWHKFFEHAKTIVCMGKGQWLSFIMQFTTTPAELDTALCQYWQAYINNASPKMIVIDLDTRRLILCCHPRYCKDFKASDIRDKMQPQSDK